MNWFNRRKNSTKAIRKATSICPLLFLTVVAGSVIMKNTNSWYMGPVRGETSVKKECPVIMLLIKEKNTKLIT
jgi:hypothetical protein